MGQPSVLGVPLFKGLVLLVGPSLSLSCGRQRGRSKSPKSPKCPPIPGSPGRHPRPGGRPQRSALVLLLRYPPELTLWTTLARDAAHPTAAKTLLSYGPRPLFAVFFWGGSPGLPSLRGRIPRPFVLGSGPTPMNWTPDGTIRVMGEAGEECATLGVQAVKAERYPHIQDVLF